jgi:hypothetical protein
VRHGGPKVANKRFVRRRVARKKRTSRKAANRSNRAKQDGANRLAGAARVRAGRTDLRGIIARSEEIAASAQVHVETKVNSEASVIPAGRNGMLIAITTQIGKKGQHRKKSVTYVPNGDRNHRRPFAKSRPSQPRSVCGTRSLVRRPNKQRS